MMAGSSRDLLAQIIRFAFSGGIATALYAALALLLHAYTGLTIVSTHAFAFALAIPVSFLLQMHFTFRFAGARSAAFARFVVTAGATFVASTLFVSWAARNELHPMIGVLVTIAAIPMVSFVTMLLWVFVDASGRGEPRL